jgi:hypothetical protein
LSRTGNQRHCLFACLFAHASIMVATTAATNTV